MTERRSPDRDVLPAPEALGLSRMARLVRSALLEIARLRQAEAFWAQWRERQAQ